MELAREQGFNSILICGVPEYYSKFGFKIADKFGITMPDGSNSDAFNIQHKTPPQHRFTVKKN